MERARRGSGRRPVIGNKLANEVGMTDDRLSATPTVATETIWDGGRAGTGLSADGRALILGDPAGWRAEQLLLLAAEASFMDAFLAGAADVNLQVLGYLSSGHLDVPA